MSILLKRSMPPGEDVGDQVEYCSTCRPCCTIPHGPVAVTTAVFASLAYVFTLAMAGGCNMMKAHFHYCVQPKPAFGTCGDCHCIKASPADTCPSGDAVPRMNFSQETLDMWLALEYTNPMTIDCNPYKNETCKTQPPQTHLELWEDATCGVLYNTSSLDSDQCPTQYQTVTYPSLAALEAAGAELTHYGSCGVCSSLQDLAVYVGNPDLTSTGQICGLIGLVDEVEAVECFMDAGYTKPCAEMWVYNTIKTREACYDICMEFTMAGYPNNGPPPVCEIAPCLQCDEDNSGPFFKTVAARTRRRSGLLSKIARPCSAILLVNHQDPCPSRNGTTPIADRTETGPICTEIENNVGPLFFATTRSNILFDLGFLSPPDVQFTKSYYPACERYSLKNAVDGFWASVGQQAGPTWRFSAFSTIIAVLLGGICMVLVWTTTCTAYKQNFWTAMCASFFVTGTFQFLALVYFASDVCPPGGCPVLKDTAFAIVAGILWYITAILSCCARGPAKPGKTIACCCCPDTSRDVIVGGGVGAGASSWDAETEKLFSVNQGGCPTTRIAVTEMMQRDGTIITEKVTIKPDGGKIVETISKRVTDHPVAAAAGGGGDSAAIKTEVVAPADNNDEAVSTDKEAVESAIKDESTPHNETEIKE